MLDQKSFEDLFKLYYVPLCYYARKYNLDKTEVEEVVQQVFIRLWEIRDKLSIEKSMSSYLYQSVRNQSINFLKKKQVTSKNKEKYAEKLKQAMLITEISEEDGTSAVLAKELEQKIDDAIDNLPNKCREIFLLSRKEYLSNNEIADKLNVSVNTVQKQISIAISKLREMLKYYFTAIWIILKLIF